MKKLGVLLLISVVFILEGCNTWQSYRRNDGLNKSQHGTISYVKGGRAFCHSSR